jgi:outer membrane protein assembly factor BamE (lipoprotein component of BamABCDE complex)
MRSKFILLSLAVTTLTMGGCAPTISQHGYLAFDAKPSTDIKVGDSSTTVLDRLGSPSQTSSYDPWEWYYIDQTLVKMTYKPTSVSARNITKINFDPQTHVVASVETLDIKAGRVIVPDPHKTPTRGRTVSALEQILGTVGRQRITDDRDNPGNQRRRE